MMSSATLLKKPEIKTELPGPKGRAIVEADAQFVNPAYPRPDFKLVAKRGEGVWVEDVDGNLLLDCNAGVAVCSTGHCHPEVVRAIQEQAAQLIHMCGTDYYYAGMPELAKKLDEIVPVQRPTRTHFANSGTEAVETALKLAMHATGREKFISFFGSFHGRTLGSLSLTSSRAAQRLGFKRQVLDVVHMPYPNEYRNPFNAEDCGDGGVVHLVEQAMVAAIGAGLPITEPSGNMVVDIGGGTTDIAVISLGGIVYSESVKVAGDRMDDAIMNYIKKKYNLLIGEHMAERIKFEIGSAYPFEERKTMMIKGRDLISGIPRTLVVDDAEVREALQEPIGTIVNAIKVALENTPPELAGDIIDRGVVLTGGGSLLKGMDTRFREETNLPIITVDDPLTSVVLGVGKILDELDLLAKVSVMSQANTYR
jgi:hypothetical protein